MEEKRHIDIKRESGGVANIGNEEDGSIIKIKNIGNQILIIKENSIYELIMADIIDPNRINISLPNSIHKRIIDKGTESEIVSRTLLTALILFKPEYLSKSIECSNLINLTIDMLSELSILEHELNEYFKSENDATQEYEERKQKQNSFKLPSIINLDTRCKTIFQKFNHIEQTLIDIITEFYPNIGLKKQSHFPMFYQKIKEIYGETDKFVLFIANTLYFMEVIYELRNSFDHRLDFAKANNFELKSDGKIIAPSIELKNKKIKLERISISKLLKNSFANTLDIIELTFVHLASKNMITSGLPLQVRIIPEEIRQNKYVKYSFWIPFGEEGFYDQ